MTPTDEMILLLREIAQHGARTVALLEELRDRRRNVDPDGVKRTTGGQPPLSKPTHFPNFGRKAKGQIAGAEMKDLEFYRDKAQASLRNPEASRYAEHNRLLIEAIDEEIRRHTSRPPHQPGDPPPEFDS